MKEKQYSFSLEFSVRDYECDLQGVVNNANYQHYLEHARHEFLLHNGVSYSGLHEEGTDLFVIRVEIDYKSPLRSGDKFVVKLYPEMEGQLRLVFVQEIFRLPELKTVVKARVTGVAIKNGRPVRPTQLLERLGLIS
jgi:acyl-CoA thioester hydrolase